MSDIEYLEALEMMVRTLSGEPNVLEHMEKEGQQRAVNNTMVAKKMFPARENWEELGFTFTDIPGDNVLCKATLPEGWEMVAIDHSMWNNIIDEQGRVRGSMFYKAAFYDREARMELNQRYRIIIDYLDDHVTTEVYFGNPKEKVFVAGQIHKADFSSQESIDAYYDELRRLENLTKNYANLYYPNWRDETAYWDDEKDISLEGKRNK